MKQGSIARQVSALKQAGYTGPSVEIDLRTNIAKVIMRPPELSWFRLQKPMCSIWS
jgi:hypothetical protein